MAPSVKYNKTLFDSKHKAFLDLNYKADDARCLACHSSAPAGQAKRDFDDDVHTAAGLKCAECHRNDISHMMVRGYEGEGALNPAAAGEDFTCRGCHLGGETADGKTIIPGRMGAPRPIHKGLPEIHFKRLNCTVCHSGPLPAKETPRVRTARANRLGIFGVADWSTELPSIGEPVYVRDANKKLSPNRVVWPAYWARIADKKPTPLKPADVTAAAGDVLVPETPVIKILAALNGLNEVDGIAVLSYGGRVYEINSDGGLSSNPAEEPAKKGVAPAGSGPGPQRRSADAARPRFRSGQRRDLRRARSPHPEDPGRPGGHGRRPGPARPDFQELAVPHRRKRPGQERAQGRAARGRPGIPLGQGRPNRAVHRAPQSRARSTRWPAPIRP